MVSDVNLHPYIVRLSFSDANLGDACFGKLVGGLRNCATLRELNIEGCSLTDASGAPIGSILRAHASRRAAITW